MNITRMYSGEDGESHFEDMDISLGKPDRPERWSKPVKATGIIFRETSGEYDLDFHNAPRRQFVINLEGSVEVTLGDGSSRILGPGAVLLAEDTTGRGHMSRAVNNQPRKSIFVTLD